MTKIQTLLCRTNTIDVFHKLLLCTGMDFTEVGKPSRISLFIEMTMYLFY